MSKIDYECEMTNLLDGIEDKVSMEGYFSSLFSEIKNLSSLSLKKKYICIWSVGLFAQGFQRALDAENIKVDFFCDNNPAKWGEVVQGIKCISPEECLAYGDDVLILIASKYHRDIALQLKSKGILHFYEIHTVSLYYLEAVTSFLKNPGRMQDLKNNVIKLMKICSDDESKRICYGIIQNWFANDPLLCDWDYLYKEKPYFPADILKFSDKESFVDCGAFDGDTVIEFLKQVNGSFHKINAYELDSGNYAKLSRTIEIFNSSIRSKVQLHNIGLWDKQEKLQYTPLGTESSSISREGIVSIEVDAMDTLLKNEDISFIKMDIEGAEIKALMGAQKIIRRFRPKLAICIYHNLEHLWEIPLLIKNMVPEYNIYIRHHTKQQYDTVCYATLG